MACTTARCHPVLLNSISESRAYFKYSAFRLKKSTKHSCTHDLRSKWVRRHNNVLMEPCVSRLIINMICNVTYASTFTFAENTLNERGAHCLLVNNFGTRRLCRFAIDSWWQLFNREALRELFLTYGTRVSQPTPAMPRTRLMPHCCSYFRLFCLISY